MGVMKEHMHEIWSEREAYVSFRCPECREAVSAWLNIPGDVSEHYEYVSCPNCDASDHWDVVIRQDEDGYTAELEKDPETDVSIEVGYSQYDMDWDEPEPEPDAYGIFRRAMSDWNRNLRELGTPHGASSRNRMLFTTLYSILEAYLSDAIIGAANEDVAVQRKMLKLDGLKDKQISLETVLDKPDIVRDMVKTTLQGLSFHRLGVINGICESCFGKKILPRDNDERTLVMKSIDKRHDCVHRNGTTKAGVLHADITREYLEKIGGLFEEMAKTLDDAVDAMKTKEYLESLDETEAKGI
jgi:DNA-directed RNA polymerase subunit RPC12/RpoP